jgi:hypothetical protein
MQFLCSSSYKELMADVHKEKQIFESLHSDFKYVILYDVEERGSYSDGTGTGFVFNWGVFREILDPNTGFSTKYYFERSYVSKPLTSSWQDLGSWAKMDWTPQRESFFMDLSKGVEDIYAKLSFFVEYVKVGEDIPTNFSPSLTGENPGIKMPALKS